MKELLRMLWNRYIKVTCSEEKCNWWLEKGKVNWQDTEHFASCAKFSPDSTVKLVRIIQDEVFHKKLNTLLISSIQIDFFNEAGDEESLILDKNENSEVFILEGDDWFGSLTVQLEDGNIEILKVAINVRKQKILAEDRINPLPVINDKFLKLNSWQHLEVTFKQENNSFYIRTDFITLDH